MYNLFFKISFWDQQRSRKHFSENAIGVDPLKEQSRLASKTTKPFPYINANYIIEIYLVKHSSLSASRREKIALSGANGSEEMPPSRVANPTDSYNITQIRITISTTQYERDWFFGRRRAVGTQNLSLF